MRGIFDLVISVIEIFTLKNHDFENVGQSHEVQHSQWRHSMKNIRILIFLKNSNASSIPLTVYEIVILVLSLTVCEILILVLSRTVYEIVILVLSLTVYEIVILVLSLTV